MKRERQPIKCWGCKGDHMYKYCPHRSERMKTTHSMKQDEIVEDMSISVHEIYAALDKKKAKFQSHMIEV